MKFLLPVLLLTLFLTACDENRVYQKNRDFADRYWALKDTAAFEFTIPNDRVAYDLYCDIRNSVSFPYSRLFVNYYLQDSGGAVLQKKMMQTLLFDPKTGKPYGTSGLGDIYDNRVRILKNFQFPYPGKYRIAFEQYMRTDTLQGILAVGLRVEKTSSEEN